MVWFTGFPVNAVKSTSRKPEDLCKIESEHANNTGHNPLWNEVKFIDRDPHWYTRRVKEVIHLRLHPNNVNRDSVIEIQKHGCPRSRNTITGEPYDSEPPREQHTKTARIKMHQSQLLKANQSQKSILLLKGDA